MSSVNFTSNFTYEYITKRVKLTWAEIDYGIKNGIISPKVAISHAIFIIDNTDLINQSVFDLACLYENESVYPYLNDLVMSESSQDEKLSKEKWMYLILDYIYVHKNKYSDPLGVVELVYADFDYPKIIASLVRYMPLNKPVLSTKELNEERLYKKWKAYLDEQSITFTK